MTSQRIVLAAIILALAAASCNDENVVTSCIEHSECADDEMCYSDSCEPIYGESYVVHIVGANYIPAEDPDGEVWDPVGDESGPGPDPYAVLFDTDGSRCTTRHEEDTRAPGWSFRCPSPFTVEESSRFGWSIYEDDEGTEDVKIAGTPDGEEFQILVDWIRSGTFGFSEDVAITFSIEPR